MVYYNIITIIIMRETVGGWKTLAEQPTPLARSLCLSRAKVYVQKFGRVGGQRRRRRLFSGRRRQ